MYSILAEAVSNQVDANANWVQTWRETSITGTFTWELFTFSSFPPMPAASLSLLIQLLPVAMCRIPAVPKSMTTAQLQADW